MKLGILVIGLLMASPVAAQPLLNPIFSDHAVLQRDRPLHLYGDAPNGTEISVTIGTVSAHTRASRDGKWSLMLPAMSAGGPYDLIVSSGGQTQRVGDILVGDVFLCAGQSNMQLSVRRAANADAEIAAAMDASVRELSLERIASPTPLKQFSHPVAWKVETPQTAGDFSASCFYFAKELRKHVSVPIGLVTAAWGGTRLRGWTSQPVLRGLGYFDADLDMLALYARDPQTASRQWDAAWENQWHNHSSSSPWKDNTSSWLVAPQASGPWNEWPALSLPEGTAEPGVGFVGQLWLSTHVVLTADQAAKPVVLDLGRANEEEKSWVNGQGVGGSSQEPDARHALPAGLLHAGDNTVTVNIFCSWRNCGFSGPDASRAIRFSDGSAVPLSQPWRYKPVETWIAPQLPWGPMHGVGLQYNGMIAPLGPFSFKAAIWYQGESNIYFAHHYQQTLTAMMGDWRRQFGADLPFVIVQIPNYGPQPTQPVESLWSDVREAQRTAAQADPKAALVVTLDIGEAKNLHPTNKQEIGRRIAIATRHLVYGDTVAPSGPRAISATRRGDTVTVAFQDVTGALGAYNGPPNGFELCDKSTCRWAAATLDHDKVILAGAGSASNVRYCWGDSPVCTLSDVTGLPAGPVELPIKD
jgi:sialate O-acetylesterase